MTRAETIKRIDDRLNGEFFDMLKSLKYCSICQRTYHEREAEHWRMFHEKQSKDSVSEMNK